jgi:hypothetical protein
MISYHNMIFYFYYYITILSLQALQTGASLVPVYTFGQDKCFDFHISDNTFLLKLG